MDATERLLRLVTELRDELQSGTAAAEMRMPVRLDSRLDRDLGFDSLAKSELLLRIEAGFALRLPAELLSSAVTPRDFLAALGESPPKGAVPPNSQIGAVPPAPTFSEAAQLDAGGGARAAPAELTTLTAVLQWHAAQQPERTHLIHLDESDRAFPMTYGRLWTEARAVAAALQRREIAPGDAVALMLPTCPAFFPCFCGILLAGAVPVPIYPPARPSQLEDHLRRHAAILANAGARLLIATGAVALPAGLLKGQVDCLDGVVLADDLLREVREPQAVPAYAGDLALLQYTSGSTGNPKGVMLTHGQLLANIRAMGEAGGVGDDDVFVSWLPLYHDMGLICAWLSSLVYAIPFVVMSPLAFLARPERWLRAIHAYRGTLSGAPNFAYELCLKRIDDAALAGLDLSCWRLAFNGAEPVSPETVTRFAARFAPCGLRPQAIAPVYGLAECAVGLAATPGAGARIDRIRRQAFASGGRAIPADVGETDAMRFVACGKPLPGYEIRIVDATGAELPERQEGRLQFRGPSATAGYYRNPQATAQLIRDGWHDSGDYAYLAGGEVYLTGRAKDVVIKGGRNIYPQEVEEAVGELSGIRKGCVAVFGSADPASGTERLVVAAETKQTDAAALAALREAVQERVVALLGMPADDVVLSAERIVLKTSSGKVRRAASRELYERDEQGMGAAATAPRAVWLQVARLVLAGALPQLRRSVRAFAGWLAGFWSAALFCLFAGPVWLAVAVSPAPTFSWRFCGAAARLWLRLSGVGLQVRGLEHLPDDPCVLVANHASYLDGIVLVAALPWRHGSGWRFVAKRELRDNFFARPFLERLGCDFVERFDFQRSVADAERLHDSVAAGHSPIFFPEGTFTRVPGLAAFRMGAFIVAARNGIAVLPAALAGTRDVLRDGHWLPRRGRLTVSLGAPIVPAGDGWRAAVQLRNAARAAILHDCGEGDLQA
jgi:1-acyl-sn-glycerol-3-phosphate acyltransferase